MFIEAEVSCLAITLANKFKKTKLTKRKWINEWFRKRHKAGNVSHSSMYSITNCRFNNFSFVDMFLQIFKKFLLKLYTFLII